MMQNSEIDEETGVKDITQPPPGDDIHMMSAVTFDLSNKSAAAALLAPSAESTATDTASSPRKVKKDDVKEIFRASNTVGSVSTEQIVRIKTMHDKISDGVNWDFNYACLLTIASIVAGLGLATDSATTVISSMLLSPIMGPVSLDLDRVLLLVHVIGQLHQFHINSVFLGHRYELRPHHLGYSINKEISKE